MVQPRLKIQEKPIELHQDAPGFRNVIEQIFDEIPVICGIDSIECPTSTFVMAVPKSINALPTTLPHGSAIATIQCTAFAAALCARSFSVQI